MEYLYYCPHCSGLLNPGLSVIFVVESGAHRELFLFSPVPGDYTVMHRDSFPLQPGSLYTFRCPLCQADLRSAVNEDLVEIASRDSDGEPIQVNFSRVYGQRATFVRSADTVERFGEDAEVYEAVNFFGAGDAEI